MAKKQSKADSFIWTDDEVELLLNVTLQYKLLKSQENVDWESCQNKYSDIFVAFQDQYPSDQDEAEKAGKTFPHNKEAVSKAILTTKLKSIRGKYRQALDSGRKSGHGRVVLLYFELCEEIWGGSPATSAISAGIETADINVHTGDKSPSCVSLESSESASDLIVAEMSGEGGEGSTSAPVKERLDLPQAKLKGYRQDKLKKRLPAENTAQEELHIKKRMLQLMENAERQNTENLNKLTSNIAKLTSSITEGFSILRQIMYQQPMHFMPPFHAQPLGSSNFAYGHMHTPPPSQIQIKTPTPTPPPTPPPGQMHAPPNTTSAPVAAQPRVPPQEAVIEATLLKSGAMDNTSIQETQCKTEADVTTNPSPSVNIPKDTEPESKVPGSSGLQWLKAETDDEGTKANSQTDPTPEDPETTVQTNVKLEASDEGAPSQCEENKSGRPTVNLASIQKEREPTPQIR